VPVPMRLTWGRAAATGVYGGMRCFMRTMVEECCWVVGTGLYVCMYNPVPATATVPPTGALVVGLQVVGARADATTRCLVSVRAGRGIDCASQGLVVWVRGEVGDDVCGDGVGSCSDAGGGGGGDSSSSFGTGKSVGSDSVLDCARQCGYVCVRAYVVVCVW